MMIVPLPTPLLDILHRQRTSRSAVLLMLVAMYASTDGSSLRVVPDAAAW
jgi:type III secretory pathway component EscV